MSWQPVRRLGGASPGGLALPPAAPAPDQMYAPRGVWTDGERVVATDTGNHRVLIWHSWPDSDGAPADVVLGQPDMWSEGPAAGGTDVARGLNLPTGVAVVDGDLVVADAWHHRLLRYDGLPQKDFEAPVAVIGQPSPVDVEPNRGGGASATSFYWPFGFGVAGGRFWVADTGNRRVLGWDGEGVPEPERAPDVLLGQDDDTTRLDNRGSEQGPSSFRWPHAVAGDAGRLYIADAGDHRVLGWSPAPSSDSPAGLVLGQEGFDAFDEFKNRPQGAHRMRFPYAVVLEGALLAVADTSNNRVLLWDDAPSAGAGIPADAVLGQPDFDSNGENRWDAVHDDSFCWPYGLSLAGDVLAVADSGNNRVTIWRRS
jgi:hypothetical protein